MIFLPISSMELDPPEGFAIHSKIRCINKTSKGHDAPSETVYDYTFYWKDGGPVFGGAGVRYRPFWIDFACDGGQNIDNFNF